MYYMDRIKSIIQVHGYNYDRGVLTDMVKFGAGLFSLEDIFSDCQTPPKRLQLDVATALVNGRHRNGAV